jgi:putative ABC transport system substrate-binding protein
MKRRQFIKLLGGAAAAWPMAAPAQQAGKVYRIGFLWDSPAVFAEAIEAFRDGLRELGWIDGRNITIEYRWAEGRPERMRELAEELVRLKVDIIVVPSSIYTEAAKRATATIPIICVSHAGPIEPSAHVDDVERARSIAHAVGRAHQRKICGVSRARDRLISRSRAVSRSARYSCESGHVDSLARPGGNITGLSVMLPETSVKGLELLKEVVPGLSRVAVIWDPATPSHRPGLHAVELAAPVLKLQLQTLPVRAATEYDGAFAA